MPNALSIENEYPVQNTSLFSPKSLQKLKEHMYPHKFSAGSAVFREGDLADKLYYIQSGKVKVTKLAEDGKEFVMYLFQSGDFITQIDPYHDARQSFNALAVENCEIGVIQRHDLEMLLYQYGELAIEFVGWMGLMHRLTQTKLRDMMMYGKPGALCSTLIRLSNSYGVPSKDGSILISMRLTNSELADYIGCVRESVNRMLSDLRKAGALEITDGYIVIKDLAHLQNICKCELCPKQVCRI